LFESQAAFGTTFRYTGGYKNPDQTLWRGFLEAFSQLVSDFIEASRNFILDFLHKKTAKNFENQMRPCIQKELFRFLGSSKNNLLVTLSL
jgi:hypothetical protein